MAPRPGLSRIIFVIIFRHHMIRHHPSLSSLCIFIFAVVLIIAKKEERNNVVSCGRYESWRTHGPVAMAYRVPMRGRAWTIMLLWW
jgi:hypothetical protein